MSSVSPLMIGFHMGPTATPVRIADAVLHYVDRYRQRQPNSREAGGGLFMRPDVDGLLLACATGPYPTDSHSRYHFHVDLAPLNADIEQLRRAEHYFVGMWHTHPEVRPSPSIRDLEAMRRLFCNNEHTLTAMLMMIVGTSDQRSDIWLSLHTATMYECVIAKEISANAIIHSHSRWVSRLQR